MRPWDTSVHVENGRYRAGIPVAAVVVIATLAGCGSGGGGGNSGGGNPPPANTTETASVAVDWAARTRDIAAPASAEAFQVTITGSGTNPQVVTLPPQNRGSNLSAFDQTYSINIPNGVPFGTYTVSIAFLAQPQSGSGPIVGGTVGTATESLAFTGSSIDLGVLDAVGTIKSVTVAPNQVITAGSSNQDLVFTVTDTNNNVFAVTPGSVHYTVTSGQSSLSVQPSGALTAGASGLAQVTATVDGVTSAAAVVGIGTAQLNLALSGPAGTSLAFPMTYQNTSQGGTAGVAITSTVGAGQPAVTLSTGWFGQTLVTASGSYGYLTFQSWQLNGATISTNPALTLTPATQTQLSANPTATLTAVYGPRSQTSGMLTPNYNLGPGTATPQGGNAGWASLPVHVYFAKGGEQVTLPDCNPAGACGGPAPQTLIAISSSDITEITAGFNMWNTATGKTMWVAEPNIANAEVIVSENPSSPFPEYGLTIVQASQADGQASQFPPNTATAAPLTAGGPPAYSWIQLNEPPASEDGVNAVVVLGMHELGHALGLVDENSATDGLAAHGHSSVSTDVMFATPLNPDIVIVNGVVKDVGPLAPYGIITERDVNSMENLYPAVFGTTKQ